MMHRLTARSALAARPRCKIPQTESWATRPSRTRQQCCGTGQPASGTMPRVIKPSWTVRRENHQPPVHHFLRECSRISLTTDSLLVVSRHASLYSKAINHYHRLSPFPAGMQIRYSMQHYRLASGIVKPAVQISLHHPRAEGGMIISAF